MVRSLSVLSLRVALAYIVCNCAVLAPAWAVPASPEPQIIAQPDGSSFTAYLRGDECRHFYVSGPAAISDTLSEGAGINIQPIFRLVFRPECNRLRNQVRA